MRVRITYIIILALILAGLGALGVTLGIFSAQMPKTRSALKTKADRNISPWGCCLRTSCCCRCLAQSPCGRAVFPGNCWKGRNGAGGGHLGRRPGLAVPGGDAGGQEQAALPVQQPGTETDPALLRRLPGFSGWTLSTEANLRTAAFKGDTPLQYRVYLLGKGGRLSLSDWGSADALVSASWEKGRGSPQSWLLLQGN